ncbi:FecR family protein [Pseudoflavitalea rhizosphaerae]|uniref:FecR family protein n=1 Tax=Pseudoflavitalea rhizosphaerae TaxID=1884793 RepID=UPI000F8CEED4|nr:FecR family protein [Pseudoflavitalea rhizosphaerae]
METPQDRIVQLLTRYSQRTATEAELAELTEWMANTSNSAPFDAFVTQLLEQQASQQPDTQDPNWEILYKKVLAGRPALAEIPGPAPVRSIRKRWLVAASVVALLGAGAWIWSLNSGETTVPPPTANATSIGPGQEGAILTLADGSTILLDSMGNGIVSKQSGVEVVLRNGELNYGKGQPANKLSYNSMSTPKGRQFRLQLPDGTKVWLNAASSIRYPVSFAENERRVEIQGEAYFEVAANKSKPFLININNKAEVEVLGTSFNVNAYTDEPQISTTLLNGRIRVSNANTRTTSGKLLLQPGQQAQLKDDRYELIKNPDLSKVMAWKNGLFNFEGTDLKEMMRQLVRWYDIEVVYEGNVPDVHFFGKMSRKLDLSTVLAALKGFGLHFRMEERKLVIMP